MRKPPAKSFDLNTAQVRRVADRVGCPYCGAIAGELCVNHLRQPIRYKCHGDRYKVFLRITQPIHLDDAGGGP